MVRGQGNNRLKAILLLLNYPAREYKETTPLCHLREGEDPGRLNIVYHKKKFSGFPLSQE